MVAALMWRVGRLLLLHHSGVFLCLRRVLLQCLVELAVLDVLQSVLVLHVLYVLIRLVYFLICTV